MLASTVQFSSYRRSHHQHPGNPRNQPAGRTTKQPTIRFVAREPNSVPPPPTNHTGQQKSREAVINVPPMSNQPHTSGMALAPSHTQPTTTWPAGVKDAP